MTAKKTSGPQWHWTDAPRTVTPHTGRRVETPGTKKKDPKQIPKSSRPRKSGGDSGGSGGGERGFD